MRVRKMLKEARSLISDPIHWTRGGWARAEDGVACFPQDEKACSFCLEGALRLAGTRYSPEERADAVDILHHAIDGQPGGSLRSSIPGFNDNDNTKHRDVLEALNLAIDIAGQEGI